MNIVLELWETMSMETLLKAEYHVGRESASRLRSTSSAFMQHCNERSIINREAL
jgi:hypothetical protein